MGTHKKIIKPHLEFKNNKIAIKLTKIERLRSNINIIVAFSLLVSCFFLGFYLIKLGIDSIEKVVILISLFIFPIIIAYFLYNEVRSIIVAKNIEKHIKRNNER